ncbi:TSUP family transporter [Geobacter sp. AOG1]|uniref:TSUP family transporter n=1 Tax=Geobacter sp. AOG1 TaxID=1566346 RepID=UPI001CC4EB2D|nr:TSUP family transporter [Geobacter sp. AOG1]GFE57544.1 UPF0721 transmembrane protein [Geobacter sp. AOG1]
MTISYWLLPLLFATGLVAGLVDAIAGGGGLITVPVLLWTGIPPQYALGTNKLQSTFGSGSAMYHFAGAGTITLKESLEGIAFTAIGAAAGALTVQRLDPTFLRGIIPFLLLAIALYTLMTPRLGLEDIHPRLTKLPFYLCCGLALGFYDGFFGPGTGSFWVIALMLGLGYNMTTATGYTKVMNFTSNIVSLAMFILGGHVYYTAGLTMGVGQLLGARVGAGLVLSRGARFVRPIFITMSLAITAKLLFDYYR